MIAATLAVLAIMAVVMTAGWVYQRAVANGGWTDVFWTVGTGVTCAAAALVPFAPHAAPTWRQVLVAIIVSVWALRLGGYIAARVAGKPEDARYAGLRREWGDSFQRRMFGLLIVQAPATMLLSISVLLAARVPNMQLRVVDLIGASILAAAIAGETLADRQMQRFRSDPANEGRVCDTGLWGWSRHPNYFFEGFGWLAYPIIALDLARPWTWASLIAPVVMFTLLRFGSGVPPLEAAMLRTKGEAYRRYQARVSPLLLLPPKEKSS